MGFIQLKLPKRLRLKLPNTSSLRKAREEYRKWLKERGLDKLKPKKNTRTSKTKETLGLGQHRQNVPRRQTAETLKGNLEKILKQT